jgi:hypothetical protein
MVVDVVNSDMNIEMWLRMVKEVAEECQDKSRILFLDKCRKEGLVIVNEEVFLRTYWRYYNK